MRAWDSFPSLVVSSACSRRRAGGGTPRSAGLKHLDLRQRARGNLSSSPSAGRTIRCLTLRGGGAEPALSAGALEAFASSAPVSEARIARAGLEIDLARLSIDQQIGECGDLRIEAAERGVLAGGRLLLQIELHTTNTVR